MTCFGERKSFAVNSASESPVDLLRAESMETPSLKQVLRELLLSKRFQTAAVSSIAAVLLRLGFDVSLDSIMVFISPFLAYIASQGLSDFGKVATKSATSSKEKSSGD